MKKVRRTVATLAALAVAGAAQLAVAHGSRDHARLNRIGPAPAFSLTTHDGASLGLQDLRGKVVVVTFLFVSCPDTCPLLTAKLVSLQSRLGGDYGRRVMFVGITVDPDRDTPGVLKRYAAAHGVAPGGWAFLTGTPAQIGEVSRRYGVYVKKSPHGGVDHTFLTSVIDPSGTMRVQYLGTRFDPDELLRDIRSVLRETAS